ncbi:hypothetical protein EWJ91_21880 [Salmonella enterica subsp. enterica serovar Ouagadougou]|uniref:Uncharacterized protein n=1 Tax=Salmonella enterica subsp. enterica serovar Ouagadougou TaxID=2564899 RepID=A0A5I0D6F8_SALET|nr:hypothetical protein [Salmonella enterica]EAA7110976.1 hypothetical protein [Salmonella enterica subsp. enterica serovar Ouagadougou]ECC9831356.1 hypothetical protein [Salmonella enterica subsp. enterica]ECD3898595.1 hypothetical protein [Salmonella enterica subsp. enterica serovar Gloucester]EDV4227020.1 hypothetical protein [Salmonella enterica subsp. enterica serovar Duisburg]EEA4939823.1 hypothetical protein [Salmonella enterica subsp. enterica serovar Enteritidis]
MINFEDSGLFLLELCDVFPIKRYFDISNNILAQYEGDIVYNFFHGNSWFDLAHHLDFKSDGESLEKGCLYLQCDEFKYCFPLYIYASLINHEGWAFEYSFFLHYLTPGVMEENVFSDFIEQFNEQQRVLIYEFVLYKVKNVQDPMAIDAFARFWMLYS